MASNMTRAELINMVEERPDSLEERIARLEAKEAIHDVMMLYGHRSDSRDTEGTLALYTEDVERVLTGTLDEEIEGKDVLRNLYRNPVLPTKDGRSLGDAAKYKSGRRMTVRHMLAAPVVRLSEDMQTGWLTAYFTLVRSVVKPDGFERHVHEGTYLFTFVRQGDEWKISRMVVDSEIGHDRGFQPGDAKEPAKGATT